MGAARWLLFERCARELMELAYSVPILRRHITVCPLGGGGGPWIPQMGTWMRAAGGRAGGALAGPKCDPLPDPGPPPVPSLLATGWPPFSRRGRAGGAGAACSRAPHAVAVACTTQRTSPIPVPGGWGRGLHRGLASLQGGYGSNSIAGACIRLCCAASNESRRSRGYRGW